VRKKVKKNVAEGIAHIHASFNNTIITITDRQGNAAVVGNVEWRRKGFKGSRKSDAVRSPGRCGSGRQGRDAQDQGIKNLDVRIKGPGPGS
jgi:small subunit ribosomal protein S11